MGKSYQFARNTLPANTHEKQRTDGESETVSDYGDLPRLALGRYVLDKTVHPNYGEDKTLYQYRHERRGVNVKGIVDFSCGHDEIFVPIVPESVFTEIIMSNHPANRDKGLRKRQQEVSRAKKRIKIELSKAIGMDIDQASAKSVALRELHMDPSFEHYDLEMFDPEANHELWGEITVGLKPQPVLIDEYTLGFNIQRDRVYVDSSTQAHRAIREAGYGVGLQSSGLNPMSNAAVPILDLNAPLSSIRSDGVPIMPRPPSYIVLGPIELVEIF